MKKPLLITLSILVFVVVILLTAAWLNNNAGTDTQQGFLDLKSGGDNLIPMVLSGFAMIAGIVFGCFYNRFTELQRHHVNRVNIGQETKVIFTSTGFYLALSASPIVFGVIMVASKGISLLPSLLLAFQNGFFWQNVMPKNFAQSQKPEKVAEEGNKDEQ
jgi:hypothetical protein